MPDLPDGLPADAFDFVPDGVPAGPKGSDGEVAVVAITPDLAPEAMNMGPGSGGGPGGGGPGGGGGGGGGKPKDPPSEPTVSENNLDEVVAILGGTAELGAGETNFYFSSGGGPRVGTTLSEVSGFDIVLEYVGDWSGGLAGIWQDALERSADFFTSFITEGLFVETTVDDVAKADAFINNGSVYWDDLWIKIDIGDIPTAGVLASAGPTAGWPSDAGTTSGALPAIGTMSIDTDNNNLSLDQATLIATHEMMHVLGVGTIWGSNPFLPSHGLVNKRGIYNGESANSAYASEFVSDGGKKPSLSVENDGGAGTAGGHWETELAVSAVSQPSDGSSAFFTDDFAYELMTGWIDLDNPQTAYLSDTSLAVLEDLGYTVDWSVDYAYDNYDFDYGLIA